jgi:hypothetical protein
MTLADFRYPRTTQLRGLGAGQPDDVVRQLEPDLAQRVDARTLGELARSLRDITRRTENRMPGNRAGEGHRLDVVAHYVIARADSGKLGYVKLNTILWYADLGYYRRRGVSMTGLREYTRTPDGPMSKDVLRAVGRLVKAGKVAEPTVKLVGYSRRDMVCLDPPDVFAFTSDETAILNQMIRVIAPLTAIQLRAVTQNDPLWQELENDQPMSIATGSIVTRDGK